MGPSLVEIAEIYRKDRAGFIKWTINPGKKRPDQAVMPSMAHVPKNDLDEIYDYIIAVTKGVRELRGPRTDPFAEASHKTRRPRIQRTFLKNTGPASLYVALPGDSQLNLIWDADQCRLRYITKGEPDDWPYLKSNGNSFSNIGKTLYTEAHSPLGTPTTNETTFKGYRVNADGLPTFFYTFDNIAVEETITESAGQAKRTFKLSKPIENLPHDFPSSPSLVTKLQMPQSTPVTEFTLIHETK